jgi:hypothetical protein
VSGSVRRPEVDELGADLDGAGLGSPLAAVLVACAAIALVLIPVTIALFQPSVPLAWLGGAAGSFGVAVGGVKLVAMAWGAGTRLFGQHPASVSAALAD